MTFKRILASICTILIVFTMFISCYCSSAALISYADNTTDNWTNVTTNAQLVEAFKYYCKSRDLTIDGSVANAVTTFTTKTFNGICNTLGIDVTALQAHLKYETDGNIGTKFLFDSTGITAYNAIFAQFLQDNNLAVGDTDVNETVDSGRWFIDADGNGCKVATASGVSINSRKQCSTIGTTYIYTWEDIKSEVQASRSKAYTYHLTSNYTYNVTLYWYDNGSYTSVTRNSGSFNTIANWGWAHRGGATHTWQYGDNGILLDTSNSKLYFGYYVNEYLGDPPSISNPYQVNNFIAYVEIPSGTAQEYIININAPIINNNIYEGDTIINENGTTGDDNGDDNNYDPYPDGGGTTTGPGSGGGNGSDGTISFPDLDLTLPEINWSLGDLSQKFPFSIPFDLIAFFTVLNAEPEAPAIDAEIPLGTWYTWRFQADFSQFDNYAAIIRNVEFIGFCVALIYLTIRLVKA